MTTPSTDPETLRARAAEIARGLFPIQIDRMVGWQGRQGMAYNGVSEALCEAGLLNADWSLSPLGIAVREYLQGNPHDD